MNPNDQPTTPPVNPPNQNPEPTPPTPAPGPTSPTPPVSSPPIPPIDNSVGAPPTGPQPPMANLTAHDPKKMMLIGLAVLVVAALVMGFLIVSGMQR